jgi:rare lipoprotein A
MESQEKNEPCGRGAEGHRASLKRAEINKTRSSRIVLVLRRRIFIGRARIMLGCFACSLALMLFAAGCARRRNARLPAPLPAKIGSTEIGIASWYGMPYDGRAAASGEIYDMEKLTAAHRALPFQTWVEITNLSNGKQVDVRITDRGPFVRGRIIDLSLAAARQIDMVRTGTARVRLKVIEPPANAAPIIAAPAVAPPVKALATTQTNADGYAVQAGAFSDPTRAQAFRETLPYSDVRVVERQGKGDQPLWKILIGRALTLQSATALAAEVEKASGAAIVVRDEAEE